MSRQSARLISLLSFCLVVLLATYLIKPTLATSPVYKPKRLAIYYGYPSLVNGANWDVNKAASEFAFFDVIVFGDGIEHSYHGDHVNTKIIIQKLRSQGKEIFGYIDMGVFPAPPAQNLSIETAQQYVNEWLAMGVSGIFWDDAGFDFHVTRDRQNTLVNYSHGKGLAVMLNAWNPDDVLTSSPSIPYTFNDYCLIESWMISQAYPNLYEDLTQWQTRANKYFNNSKALGVQLAAISSGPNTSSPFQYAWWGATMYGINAFGYTNIEYSSYGTEANVLRKLTNPPPDSFGSSFLDDRIIQVSPNQYKRRTDKGTIYVEENGGRKGYFKAKTATGYTENDYNVWKCEYLNNGHCLNPNSTNQSDFNHDGVVNLIDFEIWRANSTL